MTTLSHPLALLLFIPLTVLTLALWRRRLARHGMNRREVGAVVARLLMLSAIVLALADPAVDFVQSRQAVVFVADLSASNAARTGTMRALIEAAARARPSDGRMGVVAVGRDAVVEEPVTPLTGFSRFRVKVNPSQTNLAGGLDLAGALLPTGFRHRVVLLTDGRQNTGDALTSARLLRAHRVRVDVVPLDPPHTMDVLVSSVKAPERLHAHQRFSLTVSIRATRDTVGRLAIYRDRTLVLRQRTRLKAGENTFTFEQPALRPRFHTFSVKIDTPGDTNRQNNIGSAFTLVQGPARILVVAADAAKAANIVASLHAGGMTADLRKPVDVRDASGALQRYAAVVIVDTPAHALGQLFMGRLVPYVRDLGHGLVVTGGNQSYGLGDYAGTPLESVLPVTMQPPSRKDLPTVAVALIIEDLETSKNVQISKEAGKSLVSLLGPGDQVAVNDTPTDGSSGWAVPLQHVRDKRAIMSVIDHMTPDDPLDYSPFMARARRVLHKAHARVKHIILLGDGDADGPSKQLIRAIHAEGITVSTVATNDLFGLEVPDKMKNVARWGGGHYYRAANPKLVPRIFVREGHALSRSSTVNERFVPKEVSPNPILRGLSSVPPLTGYVVTRPKSAGEVVLRSTKRDPVLATWQFGLGRSVAWTSDAAGRWTGQWLRSPGARSFWLNLVSWTLPDANTGALFLSTRHAHGQGSISATVPAGLRGSARLTAHILDPQMHASTLPLDPAAPGRYTAAFPSPNPGVYLVSVEARDRHTVLTGQTALDVPYSSEYRRAATDRPFLHRLAFQGAGAVIADPGLFWKDNLSAAFDRRSLGGVFLLLAVLLLPIDVALRHLHFVGRSFLTHRE